MNISSHAFFRLIGVVVFSISYTQAGFLEMPETDQVPELEHETMLLDLDVPSVRERDPDPEGGPRLNVKEFKIQGIVEYPELGITRESLIKHVEKIRFEIMQEGSQLDSGYTIDELGEVSDLLGHIEEETKGDHVTSVEVQRLVFLIREQRRKRGITLGMIETVADVITRYYRERGFILAKAYIPQQKVRDGIVTLTLLLGELGDVNISNNARYSDRMISRVFDDAIGEPITSKDIEQRLYRVNDLPGLSVQGYFEPGGQIGDSRLGVNVTSEKLYSGNVRVDDHGSPSSGEYRLYTDFYLYNPLNIGDKLQIGVLNSYSPSNSTYGLIRYDTRFFHPNVNVFASTSTNDFVIGDDVNEIVGIDVSGESTVTEFGIDYSFRRSRVSNHSLSLSLTELDTEIATESSSGSGAPLITKDVINVTKLEYYFDFISEQSKILHQGSITIKNIEYKEGAIGVQKESLSILTYDYSMLRFVHIPFFDADTRVVLRSAGQYADESLASSVQFGLAGPVRTRGYKANKAFADDAIYIGFDWIFNGPGFDDIQFFDTKLSHVIQPYLLADYSYGIKHPVSLTGSDDITSTLSSIGLGLKFNYKAFRGSLTLAKPLQDETSFDSLEPEDDSSENVFFDVQYSF